MSATALIIDDEPDIRELLEITLSRMDINCYCVGDLAAARSALADSSFDLCLTDMKLPDGDGIELVSYVQEHCPNMPIAVITAHGNMETAIQSLKAGAYDFLSKPIDLPLLRQLTENALKLSTQSALLDTGLVGDCDKMQELRERINRVARTQAPIYIFGESGTGKELVARMIHEQGNRSDGPFIAINCGAIPAELMESEFFGHLKGSFTGAHADKQGLFSAADGGTLFLDEVAELPSSMQVKLLRVLQEKKVRAVGAEHELSVDVRIISASHRDLSRQVEQGLFRNDLFFRINVIQLDIPALRERGEDIPQLARHILKRVLGPSNQDSITLADDALAYLKAHDFPGNVRELENIMERAVAFCEGDAIHRQHIEIKTVPEEQLSNSAMPMPKLTSDYNLERYLEDIERRVIAEACEDFNWKKSAVAEHLGISLRSLRYKLKKLGLE